MSARGYNPLDKRHLGESVAKAALETPIRPLPPERFPGAGVYLIYYVGDFPAYRHLRDANVGPGPRLPIYIGKAVPKGARKGGFGLDEDPGYVMFGRLSEHAASITQAENLELSDFSCRYLVVDDIWIPLAESLLIEMFQPLWNKEIDGFGNHDPGSGRRRQKKSPWDALHPGRPWASLLELPARPPDELAERADEYLGRGYYDQ